MKKRNYSRVNFLKKRIIYNILIFSIQNVDRLLPPEVFEKNDMRFHEVEKTAGVQN